MYDENKSYHCLKTKSWDKMWDKVGELEKQTTSLDNRVNNNKESIVNQDRLIEGIHKLTQTVSLLSHNVENMQENLDKVSKKVDTLERKPADRFDRYKDHAFKVSLGAFLLYVIQKIIENL